jgi:GH24 family phage-related lysozyme (muramidase)
MKAIVELVAKKDYEGIAEEIERSKRLWEGKGLDGLVKRRESEADMVRDSMA